ncbi:MAG: glycogen synthase GlgA [Elusimicrobia bacterium]|nr:glycogen synthase GlgA [Elusimicrobiota bacterium]
MRVVHAASEAVPFAKTGGLADVAGALPKALAAQGVQTSLFIPCHRSARRALGPARQAVRLPVPLGGATVECAVLRAGEGAVDVYLVDYPAFFDRPGLYGEDGKDYPDNAERFAFFARAVVEACRALSLAPDVLHCHDWQTGLIPAYLSTLYRDDLALARARTVFTIHNLAYQGVFPKETMAVTGLPAAEFSPELLEYWGKLSYLKAGLVYADLITTVSETYAREIQTAEFGCGLDGLLRKRTADLHGVRNGLDLELWDPSRDESLPKPYGAADRALSRGSAASGSVGAAFEVGPGKAAAKAALQEALGLERRPDAFLVGSVTRLDAQKGVDLALAAVEPLLARGAQYVLLGSGDPALERAAEAFAARHPGAVRVTRGFDDGLARRIYAACDAFLMPSRFEPCGLGQLIAMRYGTVPVATRTGGLADTVPPYGFLAQRVDAASVAAALAEAAAAFSDARVWSKRRAGCMGLDWGWVPAARRMRELYDLLGVRVVGRR